MRAVLLFEALKYQREMLIEACKLGNISKIHALLEEVVPNNQEQEASLNHLKTLAREYKFKKIIAILTGAE